MVPGTGEWGVGNGQSGTRDRRGRPSLRVAYGSAAVPAKTFKCVMFNYASLNYTGGFWDRRQTCHDLATPCFHFARHFSKLPETQVVFVILKNRQ